MAGCLNRDRAAPRRAKTWFSIPITETARTKLLAQWTPALALGVHVGTGAVVVGEVAGIVQPVWEREPVEDWANEPGGRDATTRARPQRVRKRSANCQQVAA